MIDAERLRALLEGRYGVAEAPWEHAFVANAQGRFDRAIALASAARSDLDTSIAFQARLTLGSALRQTGRYAEAADVDDPDADPPPSAIAKGHLAVSRAADAVGLGRLADAERYVGIASSLEPRSAMKDADIDVIRYRVRLGWVAAEIALLRGEPDAALIALERHAEPPCGWVRHHAKTALFRGVVLRDLGRVEQAVGLLVRARDLASPIGAMPIVEVATRILATLDP